MTTAMIVSNTSALRIVQNAAAVALVHLGPLLAWIVLLDGRKIQQQIPLLPVQLAPKEDIRRTSVPLLAPTVRLELMRTKLESVQKMNEATKGK